jgi:hypothetical protein
MKATICPRSMKITLRQASRVAVTSATALDVSQWGGGLHNNRLGLSSIVTGSVCSRLSFPFVLVVVQAPTVSRILKATS